ncbi:hypothetical protein DPMN_057614, partial [Dreissena polymorpha]
YRNRDPFALQTGMRFFFFLCWYGLYSGLATARSLTYYLSNNYDYTQFNPFFDGLRVNTMTSLVFQTRGNNDAHVLLLHVNNNFDNNVVEIVIGGYVNSKSVIRNQMQGNNLAEYLVGKGSIVGDSQIMQWCGPYYSINGIRFSYGFGSTGAFVIPLPIVVAPATRALTTAARQPTTVMPGTRFSEGLKRLRALMAHDINECAPVPCKNGATCSNLLNAYSCTCAPGWQGTNCEQDINECSPAPCKNSATCNNLLNTYLCTCAPGWQGTNCDQDINECVPVPCKNGATCNDLLNAYSCTCEPGWQGTNYVNECATVPCKNGASCNNLLNAYSCTCVPGWRGTNCEQDINECAIVPCRNNATCNNLLNAYSCTCAPGWQGTNYINECAPAPCKNITTYIDLLNAYSCTCAPGWQGTDCNQGITKRA